METDFSQHDSLVLRQSVAPAAQAASADGASIDLSDPATVPSAHSFLIEVGAWTDGTHVIHFERSDDDSTWTAIDALLLDGFDHDAAQQLDSGGQTLTISDATLDGASIMIGMTDAPLYVRARLALTGETLGAVYGVSVLSRRRWPGRTPMRSGWRTDSTEQEI